MPEHQGGFRPTPNFRERRRAKLASVTLREAGGRAREVMVRDVSARGISIVARGAALALDEIVGVAFPDGMELRGIVRWTRGNLFGVEFDLAVHADGASDPARPFLASEAD